MKRITPALYAKSFLEAARASRGAPQDGIVERFIALIQKGGDLRKLPAIIRECEKLERKESGRHLLTIEAARRLPASSRASLENAFAAHLTDIEEKINPALIAGVCLTRDEEDQLDGSLAAMLNQIFE